MDQRINRLVDPDLRVYLVRTVRNRGASLEDAEDVVQSVLTKMLSDETREVFDRDEDTRQFLTRCVFNRWADELKSARRQRSESLDAASSGVGFTPVDETPEPGALVVLRCDLHRELAQLGGRERVVLSDLVDGRTDQETATRLRLSNGAVRKQRSAMRARIDLALGA